MSQVKAKSNGNHCLIEEYEDVFDDEDEDCEIELVVQGRTIAVSENLLCKHSLYFKQVFNDFDESQETIILKHKQVGGEEIPDHKQQEPLSMISFITMTTIIEYLNTGFLKMNDQNIRQLLYASELLTMPAIESQCFTYLKSQLTVRNCVKSFLLASAKKSWINLARFIKNYIIVHFDKVKKLSSIYKLLSPEQFLDIIKSEHLNVTYEEEIVDVIYNWVGANEDERNRYLPQLIQTVQWELIRSTEYFERVLQDKSVTEDLPSVKIVRNGQDYFNLDYQQKLEHWQHHKKPSRWPKMLAALSYAEKLVECYDFEEKTWIVLTEKPGHVFGSAMCYTQGKIYTLGGVQSKQVDQYDVETDTWADFFPSLRHCRVAHGAVADTEHDTLYVTGGSAKANANFGPGLYEMELCKIPTDKKVKPEWKTAGTMSEGRSFLGSVALDGKVYQLAGCLNEDFSTNEVWDSRTGKFDHIAKCLGKRDSQGQAVLEGEIYVVGGYDNITTKYLKSVEKYCPEANKWFRVASMNTARRSPGVVSYRNHLYVVGGMGVEDDLSSVEVFNPFSGEWSFLPLEMKEVNGWCSACLVDKPVRMMLNKIEFKSQKGCDIDWEMDSGDSVATTPSSGSGDGRQKNWEWDTSENARTQQRLKQMKDSFKTSTS